MTRQVHQQLNSLSLARKLWQISWALGLVLTNEQHVDKRIMPHFIIDCSENVIQQKSPEEIMQVVYETAEETGLFADNDIKVRLCPYQYFQLGADKKDFIHIFGHIMEGRTTEQKAALSRQIIQRLNQLLPDLSILSINISEFEKATYSNKALIHPNNTAHDRHFDVRTSGQTPS